MKTKSKPITSALMMLIFLCVASMPYAGTKAKFAIIPTSGSITSWLLPSNFTETIQYQITNQTATTYQLRMTPIVGITQITTGTSACPNPFTLASQQSCLLNLQIDGSQIPASGVFSGPVVCKTKNGGSDPFLCSQPSLENTLAVSSTTTGQHIYITNSGANTLSSCQVNPATGGLTNCSVTADASFSLPEAVTINPLGNFLYVANPTGNSISVCRLNSETGSLSDCQDAGGSGFILPSGVAVSPDGLYLYASNGDTAAGVSACDIDTTTGLLSNCFNNTNAAFDALFDMTLNTRGTRAYIANNGNSTIAVCHVTNRILSTCEVVASDTFSGPEGVTLTPAGRFLYVANNTSNQVSVCEVNTLTELPENCEITEGSFDGIGNVGLDAPGTFAYVPNFTGNRLFRCNASLVDGRLSGCDDLLMTNLNNPAGIILR